jgi:hypothetical protein
MGSVSYVCDHAAASSKARAKRAWRQLNLTEGKYGFEE